MPRIKTAPSAVPVARKPVHYHLLLRPVLQRRFARSSLWTFVVCCVVSYLVGKHYGSTSTQFCLTYCWSFLASSFLLPWTATFSRGFVIFLTLFPVLIIRKADLHGMREAESLWFGLVQFHPQRTPFSIVARELGSVNTIHAIMAHMMSAFCLTWLYLGNITESARLTPTIARFSPTAYKADFW